MWEKILAADVAKVPMSMSAILIFFAFVMVLILWNIQRDKNNRVDLKDLICVDGRINEAKFARFTAFMVSTWGFIYLIIDERFSEWYFAGYMAAWAGNALLSKYLTVRANQIDGTTPPPTQSSKLSPTPSAPPSPDTLANPPRF